MVKVCRPAIVFTKINPYIPSSNGDGGKEKKRKECKVPRVRDLKISLGIEVPIPSYVVANSDLLLQVQYVTKTMIKILWVFCLFYFLLLKKIPPDIFLEIPIRGNNSGKSYMNYLP